VASELREENLPYIAMLIPCLNEEEDIEAKLENTLKLDYPAERVRILVLDDGSEDATAELAARFAGTNKGRKIEVLGFPENRGKGRTLLDGVQWLRQHSPQTEILVFTDANAQWAPDALRHLVAPFADPLVGSVSGLLRYRIPDESAAGQMEGLYWRYERLLKRLSSRLGALPGANGSIFALRMEAYKPLTETRGDDLELAVQAIIEGYRSILVEEARSYEPPSPDFLTEYRRKVRITGQMIPSALMLFGRAVASRRALLAFELFSHKLLRYLVPFYQMALLASAGLLWNTALFYRIAFLIQVGFYLLAVVGLVLERAGSRPPKLLHLPVYFTLVNTASFVSILRVATGQRVYWERNR
jgi:cellulose synthase/poly-beta-1,6-N-acetylglucosamine synthase-like glycosyltransferase